MFELNKEELEKATGGKRDGRYSFDNESFIHKCKYELGWTKSQYLQYCRSNGASEAEIAAASATWDRL